MMRATTLPFVVVALVLARWARAANPIVNVSMADPHIRIFGNRAYLYSGWDANMSSTVFNMPSWRIYSSSDLVEWTLETVIEPTQTFMGPSTSCWATDCVEVNGSYYFYFSNGHVDIGVMRAPSPTGPFIDELGAPLFPANLTGCECRQEEERVWRLSCSLPHYLQTISTTRLSSLTLMELLT